jgi:hypothetical protein
MNMIVLQRIIWMQILWLVMALTYNLISWWQIGQDQPTLSPTNPVAAFFVVTMITLPVIWSGLVAKFRCYLHLNWLFILLTGGAVYTHFISYLHDDGLSSYSSITTWILAFLINLFGVVAGLLGTWQVFRFVYIDDKESSL